MDLPFGLRVKREEGYPPVRSVLGEIDTSPSGNVILRVGRENGSGWTQTEHVVLTPHETENLTGKLQRVLARAQDGTGIASIQRIRIAIDQESIEVGEASDDGHEEAYSQGAIDGLKQALAIILGEREAAAFLRREEAA